MEIRRLKNPTTKDTEFMYGGQTFVIKAGQEESFSAEVAKHYTQHVNGPLVDITDEPAPEKKAEEPKKEA